MVHSFPTRRSSDLVGPSGGQVADCAEECRRGIQRTEGQGEKDESWHLRILLSHCLCEQGDFCGSVAVLEPTLVTDDISIDTQAHVLNQKAFGLSRGGNFV